MKTTRRSLELTEARRCIERWRGERTSRKEAIPDHVWTAAEAAARANGIWSTSQALRLEFNRLKARVVGTPGKALMPARAASAESAGRGGGDGRAAVGKPRRPREPAFVEVVLDLARDVDAAPQAVGKAVIELMGRQGERMRIEVATLTAVDVVGLSQAFWRRQP